MISFDIEMADSRVSTCIIKELKFPVPQWKQCVIVSACRNLFNWPIEIENDFATARN